MLDNIALGLLWYVVFVFSTTCHEAAHAFLAKWGGDLTAFNGGQATLNPAPHIKREPFGMVLFPLLTFFTAGWMMGWASAPYDPDWSYRHPHRAAKMALAGPVSNFLLAAVAGLAIHVGIWMKFFLAPESARFSQMVDPASTGLADPLAKLLSLVFSLNVLLGAFNLLPIPPLDGFSVIGLLMSEDRARRLEEMGHTMRRFAYVGMILSWQVFGGLYDPLFGVALKLLYPLQQYS